jgi:hypothetical protein
MTPVAAAVLPHPPLLVPELAGAAAAELDPLRAACREALAAVVAAAELVVVVADGPVWGVPEPSATGSFRSYGADVEVALPAQAAVDLPGLPAPARLPDLPLSLAVAAHLLAGLASPAAGLFAATVPASLGPGAAAAIGHALAAAEPRGQATRSARGAGTPGDPAMPDRSPAGPRAGPSAGSSVDPPVGGGRVGLVAMGDLSACRTELAPGALRPEAAELDASVAEALRTGKPGRLLDLDPALAADLLVAGRVPLQVLAGAFEGGPAVHGRILYDDAPYGVGYLVALLTAT